MAPAASDNRFVRTADGAAELLAPFFEPDAAETLAVLYLDRERRLLGLGEYPGRVDEVELPVRAVLAEALRLGAEGLIVAHNHPSGDPSPSASDREATRMLAETARGLGIVLHDHLIFGGGGCTSLRAMGLL